MSLHTKVTRLFAPSGTDLIHVLWGLGLEIKAAAQSFPSVAESILSSIAGYSLSTGCGAEVRQGLYFGMGRSLMDQGCSAQGPVKTGNPRFYSSHREQFHKKGAVGRWLTGTGKSPRVPLGPR